MTERLDNDGQVLIPLTGEEAERAMEELLALGVESAAICLLHSFRNPAHERMLRDLILATRPGFPVSISSELVPEVREYERTSTTVANAYTMPAVRQYMEELEQAYQHLRNEVNNFMEEKVEEVLREIKTYVNKRVNKFSQIHSVVLQPVPFKKTATQKIKRFLYS